MKRTLMFTFLLLGLSISSVDGMQRRKRKGSSEVSKENVEMQKGDVLLELHTTYAEGTPQRERLNDSSPLLHAIANFEGVGDNNIRVVGADDDEAASVAQEFLKNLAGVVSRDDHTLVFDSSKLPCLRAKRARNKFLAALTSPYGQAGTAALALTAGFLARGFFTRK